MRLMPAALRRWYFAAWYDAIVITPLMLRATISARLAMPRFIFRCAYACHCFWCHATRDTCRHYFLRRLCCCEFMLFAICYTLICRFRDTIRCYYARWCCDACRLYWCCWLCFLLLSAYIMLRLRCHVFAAISAFAMLIARHCHALIFSDATYTPRFHLHFLPDAVAAAYLRRRRRHTMPMLIAVYVYFDYAAALFFSRTLRYLLILFNIDDYFISLATILHFIIAFITPPMPLIIAAIITFDMLPPLPLSPLIIDDSAIFYFTRYFSIILSLPFDADNIFRRHWCHVHFAFSSPFRCRCCPRSDIFCAAMPRCFAAAAIIYLFRLFSLAPDALFRLAPRRAAMLIRRRFFERWCRALFSWLFLDLFHHALRCRCDYWLSCRRCRCRLPLIHTPRFRWCRCLMLPLRFITLLLFILRHWYYCRSLPFIYAIKSHYWCFAMPLFLRHWLRFHYFR